MSWKPRLIELRENYFKTKLPEMTKDHGVPAPKPYKDGDSNGLTRCIKEWIKFSGGDAQRVNTGGIMRKVNGTMKWTRSGSRKGSADISAIYLGRALAIEVKIGKDKQSEAQRQEEKRITAAGGLYFVATSMTAFVDWWDSITKKITPDVIS